MHVDDVILLLLFIFLFFFFFSSRRRHTRYIGDWSSDVCSSDLCLIWICSRQISACGTRWSSTRCCNRDCTCTVCNRYSGTRSEERRVGKECRSRWWTDDKKKKEIRRGSEKRVQHRRDDVKR